MVTRARAFLGGLDGIVYNVGVPGVATLEASTPETWDATFAVNLRGAMLTARVALPLLEPGSSVVFISSIAALEPTGRIVAYEASKAALGALIRAVAFDGKERSIRPNVVMLGMIDTGLGRTRMTARPSDHPRAARSPRHRMGGGICRPLPPVGQVRLHHRPDPRRRRWPDDPVTTSEIVGAADAGAYAEAVTTQPSPRRTRRKRLLDAAMDVFAEKGYSGATISEIERRVGLAAGTGSLYRHFPSKEALLKEAVEYEVARCRAEIQEARAALPHLIDPLERQVQRYRQTLHDLGRFDRLMRLMLNEGGRVPSWPRRSRWPCSGRSRAIPKTRRMSSKRSRSPRWAATISSPSCKADRSMACRRSDSSRSSPT